MKAFKGLAVSLLLGLFNAGCANTLVAPPTQAFHSIECEDVGRVASVTSDEKLVVEFLNKRDRAVEMYWIDFDGKEVLKTSISPGETWAQNTYITHPWVVRELSGACIAAYDSTSSVLVEIR